MQLFVIDCDPAAAARMLCDVHLRKMCLENAQILSALLLRRSRELLPGMPRPHILNHPVITALDSSFKINWALRHNAALHREYFRRFGKKHAFYHWHCHYHRMLGEFCREKTAPDWSFARNFKDFQTPHTGIVAAYRDYYRHKKATLKNWHYTRRAEPGWLTASSGRCELFLNVAADHHPVLDKRKVKRRDHIEGQQ